MPSIYSQRDFKGTIVRAFALTKKPTLAPKDLALTALSYYEGEELAKELLAEPPNKYGGRPYQIDLARLKLGDLLWKLLQQGLIEKLSRGQYRITNAGKEYYTTKVKPYWR